jgi:GntR family transcriptional regulator
MSGERAIAFLVDVVPADLLDPRRLRESFDGSVLDLLLRRGDPPLHHSWTELSSQATDALLARSLGLRKGDPLLRLTARLYSTDGRVVDYSESYFTSGHFRFHVIRRVGTLAPAPWQRDPGMQEVHAMAAAAVDS